MKNTLLFLSLSFLLAFPAFCSCDQKIKIGVSLPLSGNAASYGSDVRKVLEFANKRAGDKYELIFEDDKCDGREALNVVHRLIYNKQVKFITGLVCSGSLLAVAEVLEREKIISMALIATSPKVSSAGDYIFRTYPDNKKAAARLAEAVFTEHQNPGVISEQSEYAQSFLSEIERSAKLRGLLIHNQDFSARDPDCRTQLLKLKAKSVDAVFINSQTEAGFINVLRQLRSLGWQAPVYSAFFAGSAIVLEQIPHLLEGVKYVDSLPINRTTCGSCADIMDSFVSQYGALRSVESVFISAFEGFRALDLAIEAWHKQGIDPKQFLYDSKFDGLLGPWSFDKNGDVQDFEFMIKVIRGGKSFRVGDK